MWAGLRFGIAAIAAALAFAPQPLLAQDNAAQNNAAETEPVGPRELEGFSLNGTVTRPAEPQPAPSSPPQRQQPAPRTVTEPAAAAPPPAARAEVQRATADDPAPRARAGDLGPTATAVLPAPSDFSPAPAAEPQATTTSKTVFSDPIVEPALPATEGASLFPWLAALALAAAGAFYLLWRQNAQRGLATAGGPPLAFTAPAPGRAPDQARTPAPQPRAQPAPPPTPEAAAPSAPVGIVSTRLRPWIDIEFKPTRCIVDEQRATLQFEAGMFNSGSAAARDVLLEIGIFNAGPAQDEEITRFQAKAPGDGQRVPLIEPLRRVGQSSQIGVALDKLTIFEAEGRRFFVPLMVINAYYSWSTGEGRSSTSFLIGRDGADAGKMAPFRLDLGPRVFRGLGAREHHLRVRT